MKGVETSSISLCLSRSNETLTGCELMLYRELQVENKIVIRLRAGSPHEKKQSCPLPMSRLTSSSEVLQHLNARKNT